MRTACLLCFVALVSAAIAADGVWYDGDKIAPERPHQKAKAGFGVQLQLTKNASFFVDWASPSPPRLEITHTARAGETIYSVLLYFGAGKDKQDYSHVTFDGTVRDPTGKPIVHVNAVRVTHGPNLARGYDLGLSDGYMAATFSPGSAKGVYRFELTVTDHVKGVSIPVVQQLELTK